MNYKELIKYTIEDENKYWIADNLQYLVLTGSRAYDIHRPTSDYDLIGFTVPPHELVYPFNHGYIYKFSKQVPGFHQLERHHVQYKSKDYDISIYNIVKYFRLTLDNNPNMLDTLYVPQDCMLLSTELGQLVHDNRKKFLHKSLYHKFKGYAFSQLKRAINKSDGPHDYDIKHITHMFRLLNEAEQLLSEGTMNLKYNKEELEEVLNNELSLDKIEAMFHNKEDVLEELYQDSTLLERPNEQYITKLLFRCLDMYYE